jgi:hypothetical protein
MALSYAGHGSEKKNNVFLIGICVFAGWCLSTLFTRLPGLKGPVTLRLSAFAGDATLPYFFNTHRSRTNIHTYIVLFVYAVDSGTAVNGTSSSDGTWTGLPSSLPQATSGELYKNLNHTWKMPLDFLFHCETAQMDWPADHPMQLHLLFGPGSPTTVDVNHTAQLLHAAADYRAQLEDGKVPEPPAHWCSQASILPPVQGRPRIGGPGMLGAVGRCCTCCLTSAGNDLAPSLLYAQPL